MITITGLSKSFAGRQVLDGLDLTARPGEVALLVGANGCGKTTTLRHLCGLSAPDAGRVVIGSADLTTARMAALAQLSFLPQSPRFHARLTVADILTFYARLRGLPASRALEVEQQWDLVDVRGRESGRLSGGTRQRLALAVLTLPEAPVLEALRRLVRPGGELIALLNQSVFDDRPYAARLGLPELSSAWVDDTLRPAYRAAGFEIRTSEIVEGEMPHQTSWGQHLTLASGRRTRLLTAEAIGREEPG